MYGRELESRNDDYFYAVDLFNAGYWWEAHVYWELLWSQSPAPDASDFLKGLIQLAAAMVKRRAGNHAGETKLLRRSLEKLRAARARSGETFMGVRLDELITRVENGETPTLELSLPAQWTRRGSSPGEGS